MMTAIRDQLRQAVTVDERCDAMDGTIGAIMPDGPRDSDAYNARVALYQLVDRVRRGDLPPAILTGVVLAMVPADVIMRLETFSEAKPDALLYGGRGHLLSEIGVANHLECALALALLDAGVVGVDRG